ncbi:MAG: PVC-type heme-binding CxxCH protein [Pirellulales bacterium]
MNARAIFFAVAIIALPSAELIAADNGTGSSPVVKVPPGFSIELVASPPLVQRPIVAAFDDEGSLYVAESSGSNDPVETQLELLPHRIVRLEDGDGDGKFDRRTVFADRMMFPEGTLFFDGSLYVSAPPSIWKLTDTNGDGVADDRVEWFQGKTLTGCANDLHGPYLGPDGWLYWCKGAFAEQTHRVNGHEWTTRAAHVFRCRPDATGFEPVMTGGMDNPVDVVFTADGERILSATYLEGNGRRDGLAHVIYGGVYGKDHGVLAGHPRTGELMPALVLMSATAPCGMERYEAPAFGPEYRDNLFLCQFNLRKVSRHVLRPAGSSFVSDDSDFITCDNVDFHPTDVLVDADGSLLVIDTGGWYKLCCPTSQLWKPDVLGGIYRVRRAGAATPVDPRGRQIDWHGLSIEQLWRLLADNRPAVRQRAGRNFVHRGDSAAMHRFLTQLAERGVAAAISAPGPTSTSADSSCDAQTASLARAWALGRIESAEAGTLTRQMLRHEDEHVRHVALQVVSLVRDAQATSQVIELLGRDTAANRRIAAEALGRIRNSSAVRPLLAAAARAEDRILQHSITYALIELAEPAVTRTGLASDVPKTVCAALLALDQMPGGDIKAKQVIPLLNSADADLRHTARWLVTQHSEWGGELAEWFRHQLADFAERSRSDMASSAAEESLHSMLVVFASHPAIQQLLADSIQRSESSNGTKALALRVMAEAKLNQPPQHWRAAVASVLGESKLLALAIAAARGFSPAAEPDALDQALLSVAEASQHRREARIAALAVICGGLPKMPDPLFELLLGGLSLDDPVTLRSTAADALSRARLTPPQLDRLCDAIKTAGPLELNRLLAPFARSSDEQLARKLLSSLKAASSIAALRIDAVRETLADYGPEVRRLVDELESLVNVDAASQRARIEELLPLMAKGDVHRGHAVYHSAKAACSACHRLGHAGGTIGPELTRIGETRTERDLLESILFPNLSFVRSYEPVLIMTVDGRAISGVIRDETPQEYIVTVGADEEVRVLHEDVDEIVPSNVSIMPAGLDKQLSLEELADLTAFLKNAK